MSTFVKGGLVRRNLYETWEIGSITWALFSGRWWPAMVVEEVTSSEYIVFWFGDCKISKVVVTKIIPFLPNYKVIYNSDRGSIKWLQAVGEALDNLLSAKTVSTEYLHSWALSHRSTTLALPRNGIPDWIKYTLQGHACDVQKLVNSSGKVNIPLKIVRKKLTPRQISYVTNAHTTQNFDGVCLACHSKDVNQDHPFFVGQLCSGCLEDFTKVTKYKKLNDSMVFCTVCADTVNCSIICKNKNCLKAYCKKCIKYLAEDNILVKILSDDHWNCFMCLGEAYEDWFGLLQPRLDYRTYVKELGKKKENLFIDAPVLKRGKALRMMIISGTCITGSLIKTMREMKLPVERYFIISDNCDAAEIVDEGKETVRILGKLDEVKLQHLEEIENVDFLFIDAPMIEAPSYSAGSKGISIYTVYRILNLLQETCRNFYWFYETPTSVDQHYKLIVNRFLQSEPVVLQVPEARFFWGNLPIFTTGAKDGAKELFGCATGGNSSQDMDTDRQVESKWNEKFLKNCLHFLITLYR